MGNKWTSLNSQLQTKLIYYLTGRFTTKFAIYDNVVPVKSKSKAEGDNKNIFEWRFPLKRDKWL